MTPAEVALRRRIEREGPVGFDVLVDTALYDPVGGFYASGGRAGRRGDFITSPEVGPLFGAVLARALDAWWREAGQPATFVVAEVGAGPGTLARTILHAEPSCRAALRYVLVERSAAQRERHAEHLVLEDAEAVVSGDRASSHDTPALSSRPVVVSLAELPRVDPPCVVLANELLDNLPFALAERTSSGWSEVRVGASSHSLVEVLAPLDDHDARWLDAHAPDARPGARAPLQRAAATWVRDALRAAGAGGRVVAFDYCSTTPDLAARPWTEWLRTYRQHGRGDPPLVSPGSQDITCEVAVDQLGEVPTSDCSQATWLARHGLATLVDEGRRVWQESAATGDLRAVRARSRIGEAEALTDPGGLGAFRVLEWVPEAR